MIKVVDVIYIFKELLCIVINGNLYLFIGYKLI